MSDQPTEEIQATTGASSDPEVVVLSKAEFQELVDELERLALEEAKDKSYDWTLFSAVFWDNFVTKVLSNLVSVKMWILGFILYVPYELLIRGHLNGEQYTSILVIVAPIVVGLREFSKIKFNLPTNGFIDKVKSFIKR
jgi:hypothetical protein